MIATDFIYCRADTLTEAYTAYDQLQKEGKSPVYYAGGSEVITMSRAGSIQPGAVIDIKGIPECMILYTDRGGLNIGSACTLNRISTSKLFPLLGLACGRIADHTNQCRITLGGNLCGTIIYRETSLPLLVSDAAITILGRQGLRKIPINTIVTDKLQLAPGELVVQLHVPRWALKAKHFHVKYTANEKIDYPLVSVAAIQADSGLRVAFSGICSHPFRSLSIEEAISQRSQPVRKRAEKAATMLPEPAYGDVEGSALYRLFVFKHTLTALLEEYENG